jgi:hypothetical protein
LKLFTYIPGRRHEILKIIPMELIYHHSSGKMFQSIFAMGGTSNTNLIMLIKNIRQ